VRDYAAQQGISEINIAFDAGLEENSKEFIEQGSEIYSKV